MRNRVAAIIGVVVFLVLAGTGVGYALWSSNAQSTGTVKAASLAANCSAPTKLVNGGFENPNISPDAYRLIGAPFIQGWTAINDSNMEVWRSALGSTPPEGAQIIELNATAPATVYQVIDTTPGQTLTWSLQHKGRYGPDTMAVAINADGAAQIEQTRFTTDTAAWKKYQGVYTVPAGQTKTRISLVSISTTSESGQNNASYSGNFVDDVTFGTGPCLTSAATIANITTPGTTYSVGNVVEYTTTVTNSGGTASASSIFTAAIPAGLVYLPGSITVNGVAKSDAAGNDEADVTGTTITARLGQGATSTAGGAISPANSVVVKFRATIQSSATGGNLVYTSATAYADGLAPSWPLSAVSPTVTTPVSGVVSADIAVAVQSLPQLGTSSPSQPRSWVMRITNNGPAAGAGVKVVVSVPNTLTNRSVTTTSGSCTTVANDASTCTIGAMASGATVDITFTGTMPSNPQNQYAVTATASSTSTDPVSSNNTATGSVNFDNQPPTQPLNLTAVRNSATQINLAWQASNDNAGIAGYNIFRNGVLVKTTSGTGNTYSDTGLTEGTAYWYWVQAVDINGNTSAVSNGDGAVAFSTTSKYWVEMVTDATRCVAGAANSDNQAIAIQVCSTGSAALQQWSFTTIAGNNVYVKFSTGTDRRWRVADDNSSTVLRTSTTGETSNNTQWKLGASWDGTKAYVEIRRTTANTMCLDVQNGSTNAGTLVQQYSCYGGAAQRFALQVQP